MSNASRGVSTGEFELKLGKIQAARRADVLKWISAAIGILVFLGALHGGIIVPLLRSTLKDDIKTQLKERPLHPDAMPAAQIKTEMLHTREIIQAGFNELRVGLGTKIDALGDRVKRLEDRP